MKHKIEKGYWGIRDESYNREDFEFATGIDYRELPTARNHYSGREYHQVDVSYVSCTIFGSGGALSDITGKELEVMDFRERWNKALTMGASESWGWYYSKAVGLWREWWNENNPEDKVFSVRVEMGTDLMYQLLEKGYSIVMGYRHWNGYKDDWEIDGKLDNSKFGERTSGGHCIRLCKINESYYIIDNYSKTPWRIKQDRNKYKVIASIKELVDNEVFFLSGYIFVFEDDIKRYNIDMKFAKRFSHQMIVNHKNGEPFVVNSEGYKTSLNFIPTKYRKQLQELKVGQFMTEENINKIPNIK
jgi:hypothetical protein